MLCFVYFIVNCLVSKIVDWVNLLGFLSHLTPVWQRIISLSVTPARVLQMRNESRTIVESIFGLCMLPSYCARAGIRSCLYFVGALDYPGRSTEH